MLKWLVTEKEGSADILGDNIIDLTEDPLATIACLYNKRYEQTYTVNRCNPLFQDDNFSTSNTGDVQEKVHNLYRNSSTSSGYGSSSGSPDLSGPNELSSEEHITRIYIETNQAEEDDDDDKVVAEEIPYFVWHANENKFDNEEEETHAIELKSSDEHQKRLSKIHVAANPMFVQFIQVGKCCLWKSTKTEPFRQDSLVTNDLLLLTSYSEDGLDTFRDKDEVVNTPNKGMEDMDKVIEQLTAAVMRSKGISTLTKAVARREVNGRYAVGSSVAGKLRRQRQKKNEVISDDESDSSSLELKIQFSQEEFSSGNFPNYYETMLPSNRQPDPSRPLYDKTSPPGWYLARKEEKQTSFRNYQHKNQGDFISWGNRSQIFGKYPGSPGANFTLDKAREVYLKKKEKNRNCAVFCCKTICFLLLLASFLLVIIFISVFISQGKTMFGPM